MKHTLLAIILSLNTFLLLPQVVLTIEGTVVNDTETGTSLGVVIPNQLPTTLTYRNNSVTSVNSGGYMLCAGDEIPGPYNNHLDGAKITGNRFIWNGTDEESTTHGVFTGYNINVVLKYNYLFKVPNGIQRKSNGMNDNAGVIAYNIINSPKVGIVAKGMNGVRIYNNTLYSELTPSQTSRGLIDIHTNFDNGLNAPSTGTRIYNNIFYTKSRIINIKIYESICLQGFECDYNVYWCEAGDPVFEVAGMTRTFAQWQAMGYDQHSVIINPQFKDFDDFVPIMRLNYGTDLGVDMLQGLSVDAVWGKTDPEKTSQNGPWQVGARVYGATGDKIQIYPNPAIESFYVLISNDTAPYVTFKMYDSKGSVVLEGEVDKGANVIHVPNQFSSGLYTLLLETDDHKKTLHKIVIIN